MRGRPLLAAVAVEVAVLEGPASALAEASRAASKPDRGECRDPPIGDTDISACTLWTRLLDLAVKSGKRGAATNAGHAVGRKTSARWDVTERRVSWVRPGEIVL